MILFGFVSLEADVRHDLKQIVVLEINRADVKGIKEVETKQQD